MDENEALTEASLAMMINAMFCEPLEHRTLMAATPTVLFIRGATRSGGFLEGATAGARDEQLADISNTSTAPGNAGWGTLAQELRAAGYVVTQMTEPKEKVEDGSGFTVGRPIRFENLDLAQYAAIVFGSNNARYPQASIDAIHSYIEAGGSALFISDANFGSHWRDAADSDQQFVSRYNLLVQQDAAAGTPVLTRAGDDFLAPDHPILAGVNAISGEGVSNVRIFSTLTQSIVKGSAKSRLNDGLNPANGYEGTLYDSDRRTNVALALAEAGAGRVANFFDRNTFFNANGLGTDITEHDNRRFALNLFNWLADRTPPAPANVTFTQGSPRELRIEFDDRVLGLTRNDILLRDPFDATPIPRTRWGWVLDEVDGKSVLTIRIKGAQLPGPYQFQINGNRITDDALNPNGRIRYNFTIA